MGGSDWGRAAGAAGTGCRVVASCDRLAFFVEDAHAITVGVDSRAEVKTLLGFWLGLVCALDLVYGRFEERVRRPRRGRVPVPHLVRRLLLWVGCGGGAVQGVA
ncbi:unnamed protein product [Ectocarpus sp. CCAP 1310/34]|nr:unnamed protein product [Ectocarpus sp. CCAP 1310/34]